MVNMKKKIKFGLNACGCWEVVHFMNSLKDLSCGWFYEHNLMQGKERPKAYFLKVYGVDIFKNL